MFLVLWKSHNYISNSFWHKCKTSPFSIHSSLHPMHLFITLLSFINLSWLFSLYLHKLFWWFAKTFPRPINISGHPFSEFMHLNRKLSMSCWSYGEIGMKVINWLLQNGHFLPCVVAQFKQSMVFLHWLHYRGYFSDVTIE